MLVFPNAKVNLGLNVVEKRNDGFHNIETVFYPIPLQDALDIIPNSKSENIFNSTGILIPNDASGNLVEKAHKLLKKDFDIPFVDIHLHKTIPIGAGLGGGSADAGFAIKCLNNLFDLKLSIQNMENYAALLGSDCPFFIKNEAVYATGKGDVFTDLNFSLKGKFLVLIYPNIHVSTAIAYGGIVAKPSNDSIVDLLNKPLDTWKNNLVNDFEKSVFKNFPEIEQWKTFLYNNGAVYACMSGSGSSVFGIFDQNPTIVFPENCSKWTMPLS